MLARPWEGQGERKARCQLVWGLRGSACDAIGSWRVSFSARPAGITTEATSNRVELLQTSFQRLRPQDVSRIVELTILPSQQEGCAAAKAARGTPSSLVPLWSSLKEASGLWIPTVFAAHEASALVFFNDCHPHSWNCGAVTQPP